MNLELQLSSKLIWCVLPKTLLTKSDEMVRFVQVMHLLSVHLILPLFIERRVNLALIIASLKGFAIPEANKRLCLKSVLQSVFR